MATAQLQKRDAPFTIAPITYEVMKEDIAKLGNEYLALTVTSLDDKEGLNRVHAAKMHCVKLRGGIEKKRKQLKAESMEYGKKVDSAARELTALLQPIEVHLEKEEAIVAREQERIKREADEKRQAVIRGRLSALVACGATYLASDVEYMPQAQYDALLADKRREKTERDEAAKREADERARVAEQNRIESERLAGERAELDRVKQEQAAAQARIDAENKRIADEEAERVHRAEIERLQTEAAEKARLEAAAEQEQKARLAAVEAKREQDRKAEIEALRPDHEKLIAVAEAVMDIKLPTVSKNAQETARQIGELLDACSVHIREAANKLVRASEVA